MASTMLKDIAAQADNPVACEKLCGKLGVEFHPIGCDLVTAAATGDKDAKCQHVTAADRVTRQAKFEALVKSSTPAKAKAKAEPDEK